MLKMECRLLTKEEVCSNSFQIFKKYGTNAAVTDFSLLLGIEVSSDHTSDTLYFRDREFTDTRAADYWTMTKDGDRVIAISSYSFGYNSPRKINNLFIGIRPLLKYSDIKDLAYDKNISDKEVLEVHFGEYPQTVCEDKIWLELEKNYKAGNLLKSGKSYTVNSNVDGSFSPQIFDEYCYRDKKYVRFISNRDIIRTKLSSKKYIEFGRPYWIEVEPITWMIDEDKDMAVCKKSLVTGIPYDNNSSFKFEETFIYNYLNNYFIKEIETEKKEKEVNRFAAIEKEIDNMSLEELQELRFILENQIKNKVKLKRKGGII